MRQLKWLCPRSEKGDAKESSHGAWSVGHDTNAVARDACQLATVERPVLKGRRVENVYLVAR